MTIRVLLADDHRLVREALAALLAEAGAEVVGAASDGRMAVAMARELRPDVCLMDVSMPGMNGLDAAAELARFAPDVKVVFLSMHADGPHVSEAMAAGARGYVAKDSAIEDVIAAVRAVAAGRLFMGAGVAPPGGGNASALQRLSRRERHVLQLVVEGWSSAQIATRLCLSPKTVQTYRSRIMAKLEVADVAALVKLAVRMGITPPG